MHVLFHFNSVNFHVDVIGHPVNAKNIIAFIVVTPYCWSSTVPLAHLGVIRQYLTCRVLSKNKTIIS